MPRLPMGTVTFLFTDIEGSTRLLRQLGDTYASVLADYQWLLREAFRPHGAQEVDTQGDALFVAFARAKDALAAAIASQRGIIAHPWREGVSVRVRMGLHTGEPLSSETSYVGMDVHRAARICSAGHGGQILLSQTTRDLVEDDLPEGVNLRDLGEHRLKDLARPHHLFQIVAAGLPADFPPLRSLQTLPNNLPIQLTSFIGREQEKAEVKRLLSTTRLLTLAGAGGAGKTRLALQVAADLVDAFSDGVWLVELASLADPALVPQAVAAALGMREQPGRTILTTLTEYLQPRHLLLVLDNCEHLAAACAQLTDALLRTAPTLQILATSRELLGITGETAWRVPSLSLPDSRRLPPPERLREYEAVRLFTDRAAAVLPDFLLTHRNALVVAQVCQSLDGIPLAIELAAARVRVLSVEQIAQRLDDRFRLLTGGGRTTLPRHQTLRGAMDWSYVLLSEQERAVFRRLAVFAGGYTLGAAEAVCAGADIVQDEILDLLAQLVDKSLVVVEAQNADVRYRMLETIRQYAREKLVEAQEEAQVRRRHRDWFLALAEQAEPMLPGPGEWWLDRLEVEHDNLRAALELCLGSGEVEAGLRLAGALKRFWLVRGYWIEGRQRLEALLARSEGAAPAWRAKAITGAAALAQYQGDYERAVALCEESLAIQRKQGDERGMADSLNIMGNVMYERGNYGAAWKLHEKSLAYGREVEDKHAMAASLVNLAGVALHEGDYTQAVALAQESLTSFREVGDRRGIAAALHMLGVVASDQDDYVIARPRYEESLAIRRELGDKRGIAGSLSALGLVAREQGDYASARARYEESLAIQRQLGDKRGIAASLRNLGLVAWRQGDPARATALLKESLVIRNAQGNRAGIAECLEGLARVAQHPERAAKLLGTAAALREAMRAPLPPSDRSDYDRVVAAVRAALDERVFEAAWHHGRDMTLEQVVQYALTGRATPPISPLTN